MGFECLSMRHVCWCLFVGVVEIFVPVFQPIDARCCVFAFSRDFCLLRSSQCDEEANTSFRPEVGRCTA
jgi:hypothetical protein